jgi:hypothetical protein
MSSTHYMLNSSHAISLVVRFLNAEVPLLWDLGTRHVAMVFKNQAPRKHSPAVRLSLIVFLTSLMCRYVLHGTMSVCRLVDLIVCSMCIQGANTYFHVVIKATDVTLKAAQDTNSFPYSRALGPWCYNTEDGFGTAANRNFWTCALEMQLLSGNGSKASISAAKQSTWLEVDTDSHLYLTTFTDDKNVTYAIAKPPRTDTSADWIGSSYAVSTSCRTIAPALCSWSPRSEPRTDANALWAFNCSSLRAGFAGNLTDYTHRIRLDEFHLYLREEPPFTNQRRLGRLQRTGTEEFIKNVTETEANAIFNNPFTFQSQIKVTPDNEYNFPAAVKNSSLTWSRESSFKSITILTDFVFTCSVSGLSHTCPVEVANR